MPSSGSVSLNYLDQIPDKLYRRLITHQYRSPYPETINSLQQRALGILAMRNQLLRGELVNRNLLESWVDENLIDRFLIQLNNESILNKALENENYTDDVLLQVLNWLDRIDDDLTQVDDDKTVENNFFSNENGDSPFLDKNISLQQVKNGFALERQLGWDLSCGIKSNTDVNKIIETHNVIKHSKIIQSIIRMIGRKKIESFNQNMDSEFNVVNSEGIRLNQGIPDECSINSVTGVCFGDDVSHMLSSELILLANKNLKMLWHAKRAERQLLNYHYQGLLSDHVPMIQDLSIDVKSHSNLSIKNQGPIMLCVDTSASMKGRAEVIAKAIAFEAMRVASLEKRECYLFCFGSADEIIELKLNLDQGWASILDFLSISFNGGTDINNVMLSALEKCEDHSWKNADILLLSDGRFKVEENLIIKIQNIKSKISVFGLQLGKWSDKSLRAICHIVFDLSDV